MGWRTILAALAINLGIVSGLSAQTLDAETVDALERFYDHFNGDGWHNNAGWLDPEVAPCDWHGVTCGSWAGDFGIRSLELPGNNLQGDLSDSDVFKHVIERLDLSDNRIQGMLPVFPHRLRLVHLSDNELVGPLPEAPLNYGDTILHLELARNEIEGSVPESWRPLGVAYLDLSGNRLTSGWENALLAADNYINIADNRFSGSLDQQGVVVSHLLDHNETVTAGGINLCWNDFQVSSETRRDQIAERHVGGSNFQKCLGQERQAIDTTVSGSWFDPDRSGEGVSMHLLAHGGVLLYHFGFDGAGRQHWLVGIGREADLTLHWPNRIESTRGRFGEGMADEEPNGTGFGEDWRMDRLATDRFHLERTYADFTVCPANPTHPMPCPARMHSNRFDYDRLSRLAGTACDNQHPLQDLSGAWYDPERSGEGFIVEVLDDGRGLAYWFTYRPDDSMHQAWMIGTGEFEGQTLFIDEMIRPTGGAWGEDFDPEMVVEQAWGSLTIDFNDGDSGHAYWDSVDPAYGSGDYPIQRLSSVRMADCGDS